MDADKAVLLGLLDEEVGRHSTYWDSSKLGGQPDWIFDGSLNPVCKECGRKTSLLVQIYCPLEGNPYHRTLYVFACCSQTCWNKPTSWIVLRGQRKDDQYLTQNQSEPKSTPNAKTADAMFDVVDDWGDGADDWGDDVMSNQGNVTTTNITMATNNQSQSELDNSENLDSLSEITTGEMAEEATRRLEEMSIDGAQGDTASQISDGDTIESMSECCVEDFVKEPESQVLKDLLLNETGAAEATVNTDTKECITFASHFISVIEEPASTTVKSVLKHEEKLLAEYTQREGCDMQEFLPQKTTKKKGGPGETYEKSSARHGDKMFHKFQKRIALCPEQILRYSWNGGPLYMTQSAPGVSIPPCPLCGATRVFELQLLPSLLNFLKPEGGEGGVEFGTALIYTCRNSCWEDSGCSQYMEEFVVLQADTDLSLNERQETR